MGSTVKLANDLYLETSSIVHKQGDTITPLDDKIIYDSGSNSNGEYIRFADGTMICRGIIKLTSSTQYTSGGLTYYCADTYINYPAEFIYTSSKDIQMTSQTRHENMNYICNTYAVPQSKTQARISLQTTRNNYDRNIMWIAIGKWK